MFLSLKTRLNLCLAIALATLAPLAAAHGLDGHHAPFLTLVRHLLAEHGYLLLLPVALGTAWILRRRSPLRNKRR